MVGINDSVGTSVLAELTSCLLDTELVKVFNVRESTSKYTCMLHKNYKRKRNSMPWLFNVKVTGIKQIRWRKIYDDLQMFCVY